MGFVLLPRPFFFFFDGFCFIARTFVFFFDGFYFIARIFLFFIFLMGFLWAGKDRAKWGARAGKNRAEWGAQARGSSTGALCTRFTLVLLKVQSKLGCWLKSKSQELEPKFHITNEDSPLYR
jgi:hypothetical protein